MRLIPVLFVVTSVLGSSPAQSGSEAAARVRFLTDRSSPVDLPLPGQEDAFCFAIFGDRTGGPKEGVKVLAQAVDDVNLIEPDLIMTVGDLVQGYNQTEPWLEEMREFRGIMAGLKTPWFPVAGNHDIYWRGPGKPEGEHEGHYETHFGPLWYAFEHKHCWFIVLYTDEGNPETGEKAIGKPASQRMSPEQLAWLRQTLVKTEAAEQVFVFLHHPRWIGGKYGDSWSVVHEMLVAAGNVTAVFAGHIHKMRYDGVRDGIEYFALATTGGHQVGDIPQAGYLHHYNLVTVRKQHLAVATIPVGAVMDPRLVTAEVSAQARELARELRPSFVAGLVVTADGAVGDELRLTVRNPVDRGIDLTLGLSLPNRRWQADPDHVHLELAAGAETSLTFRLKRPPAPFDDAFDLPSLSLQADYLAVGLRISLPERVFRVPVEVQSLPTLPRPVGEAVLALDGRTGCLRVDDRHLDLPDGPLTVEAWLRARKFAARQGFLNKTEGSGFGFFLNAGVPSFLVFLGGSYVTVEAPDTVLGTGVWHHLAGVFDGRELGLYVDGRLVNRVPASGERKRNRLPFLIGADVTGGGRGTAFFAGEIDAVRISSVARYSGETFSPRRRFPVDGDTALLLHMDGLVGPWCRDASTAGAHATTVGTVRVVEQRSATRWFGGTHR